MAIDVLDAPTLSRAADFRALLVEQLDDDQTWSVEPVRDDAQHWIGVTRREAKPPAQGWKLHVSATVHSADEVLRRALPVLRDAGVTFKVAASHRSLSRLNDQVDGGSPSQIGKFITVYPTNDAQAVRLAAALHHATRGMAGPAIPSDRPLAPGSLVHYRYGGFDDRIIQTPAGEIVSAITGPSGELIPDRRLPAYREPDWVTDPFLAAGVAGELPAASPLIAGRYLIVSTVNGSARGAVHLAVDIVEPRSCMLKQARRGASVSVDGRDARDRLRHEAEVLARLGGDPRFPQAFDLVEQDGDLYLALEDLGGTTLGDAVTRQLERGRLVPAGQVISWGGELCAMLETIHAAGWVYRDLKSTNVIVDVDGGLKLIDFELAHELASAEPVHGRGTQGYMSPQQCAGAPPAVSDDVYGLGALLYFLATSAEPSTSPKPDALLSRAPERLNLTVDPSLTEVIARCLEPDPARRFSNPAAVRAALRALSGQERPSVPLGDEPLPCTEREARVIADKQAHRLADTLVAAARPAPGGDGRYWPSARFAGSRVPCRDLNIGSAGAVLALAELADEYREPEHFVVLSKGARWLATAPRLALEALPGLYVGEAGVGAALLRAGQVLGDTALIDVAVEQGRLVAALPHRSPDLFNGTAGRVRFHILLWDETGEAEHLADAVTAGEVLLAAAEPAGDGGIRWTIPGGYDAMSGKAYLGYAHGAAGIGDALLDLHEATGDHRYLATARGVAAWLEPLAVPVLPDEGGLNWPTEEGGKLGAAYWCHGAAGIGRFFLHLAAHEPAGRAMEMARRAGLTVARAARWAGPTQCHGLAGSIEFLLDLFRATEEGEYLPEARSLACILDAFASERDGTLVWPSDRPTLFVPEYMGGYAGVALCQLRLAEPKRRPHQLSRAGFRFRATES